MGRRIFEVYVERGRIGGADSFKSPLTAPEFHSALEVRVKNPHANLTPKALNGASLPRGYLLQAQTDKDEAREEDECGEWNM
jgi:hypothetical protein